MHICSRKGAHDSYPYTFSPSSFITCNETNKAERFFTQWYGGLSSDKLDDEYQTELVCQLERAGSLKKYNYVPGPRSQLGFARKRGPHLSGVARAIPAK